MTINYRNHDISRNDLLTVARQYSIKAAETIIDNAIAVARRYNEFAIAANVENAWIKKIDNEIQQSISVLEK